MVVTHLSRRTTGGANGAARRLHESLLAAGVDSVFCYSPRGGPAPPDPGFRPWRNPGGFARRTFDTVAGRLRRQYRKSRLAAAQRGRPPRLGLFSPPGPGWRTPYDPALLPTEILHLHWIANFIDYPSFFASVPDGMPVVWTLHDLNPLTGGCHFSAGCSNWETRCGQCPQLGMSGPDDLSRQGFAAKSAALQGKNLHVVALNHWLLEIARRSPMMAGARSFQRIPLGIDTALFAPQDRGAARRQLGLPEDRCVIGFGSQSINNHRKGFHELLAALRGLARKDSVLCAAFGSGSTPAADGLPELRMFGRIADARRLATLYAAMDFFVQPALEDNMPQTGLEAMACGTPVVAYATGGIPDYVRPGITGWLAPTGDTAALTRNIQDAVAGSTLRAQMGVAARRLIEEEYTLQGQARAYTTLYAGLIAERPGRA